LTCEAVRLHKLVYIKAATMKKEQPVEIVCSLIITILLSSCLWTYCEAALSDPNLVQTDGQFTQLREELAILRQQRQDYQKAHTANQEQLDHAKQTLEHLQSQHKTLTTQQAELDRQLNSLQQEVAALELKNAKTAQYFNAIKQEISNFTTSNTALIQNGLPCQKQERLNALASTETSSSIADSLAAIWNFAQQELRTASSAQTFSKPVELEDGRTFHARYLQIGLQFLAFVTEDSQLAGIWSKTSERAQWNIVTDKTQIQNISRAIEILDQQAQPVLLQLPFEISPITPKAEQKEVIK
jgi:hypothetical protein